MPETRKIGGIEIERYGTIEGHESYGPYYATTPGVELGTNDLLAALWDAAGRLAEVEKVANEMRQCVPVLDHKPKVLEWVARLRGEDGEA